MHGRADERCCCGRRSRVVLTPRRRRQVLRRRSRPDRKRISHIRKATVTRKPITGEITKEAVKTIARGMPGCSGEPVVTTSCAFYFLHARLRVHRAPGIPCALSRGWLMAQLGRFTPRDRGGVCDLAESLRGAKATKQSILILAMPSHGLLRWRSQ